MRYFVSDKPQVIPQALPTVPPRPPDAIMADIISEGVKAKSEKQNPIGPVCLTDKLVLEG